MVTEEKAIVSLSPVNLMCSWKVAQNFGYLFCLLLFICFKVILVYTVLREQFYLQLKEDISAGRLRFSSDSAHSVLSYVLQGKTMSFIQQYKLMSTENTFGISNSDYKWLHTGFYARSS